MTDRRGSVGSTELGQGSGKLPAGGAADREGTGGGRLHCGGGSPAVAHERRDFDKSRRKGHGQQKMVRRHTLILARGVVVGRQRNCRAVGWSGQGLCAYLHISSAELAQT